MSSFNTSFGPREISGFMQPGAAVYFIGIGGINMSSLAMLTKLHGFKTGGSDHTETALTEKLVRAGIEVHYSHNAAHLQGYSVVVFTVAIPADNPELVEAHRRGLPCVSRADYLGWVMTAYENRLGICGMHGKSTCTSMCAQVFCEAGKDPTVVSGAEMDLMNGAYRIGDSDRRYFLFEACEYMDSFLSFCPNAAVILNLEMDHVDYFHSKDQITASFARFAQLTQNAGGPIIFNGDDPWVLEAVRDCTGAAVSFGLRESNDYYAVDVCRENGFSSFTIMEDGRELCRVCLHVPGDHNVFNALGAAAAARLYGIPGDVIGRALSAFSGAKRRMEYKGTWNGVTVYDDYGHHPTEVSTTLRAARNMGFKRVICVYQPHTYSRTFGLYSKFVKAFGDADVVLMVDIYAAREANTFGVSSERLAADIGDKAHWTPTIEDAAAYLLENAKPGDLILVMGAGNVNKIFTLMDLK